MAILFDRFFHPYKDEIMAETTTKTAGKKAASKTTAPAASKVASKTVSAAEKPATKKAPAVKKPAAKKAPISSKAPISASPDTAAKLAAIKKPALKTAAGKTMTISGEQRYRMVAEAAYYRAESNQFKSDPLRDWIEAENDIATLLSGSK
ncbi:MAG: DUF2934 domain-containing protein [Propionivibrio sp.]